MKKQYQNSKKESKVEESPHNYHSLSIENNNTNQTIEEMRENVRRGIQQIKEGKFYTTDELDDIILS